MKFKSPDFQLVFQVRIYLCLYHEKMAAPQSSEAQACLVAILAFLHQFISTPPQSFYCYYTEREAGAPRETLSEILPMDLKLGNTCTVFYEKCHSAEDSLTVICFQQGTCTFSSPPSHIGQLHVFIWQTSDAFRLRNHLWKCFTQQRQPSEKFCQFFDLKIHTVYLLEKHKERVSQLTVWKCIKYIHFSYREYSCQENLIK